MDSDLPFPHICGLPLPCERTVPGSPTLEAGGVGLAAGIESDDGGSRDAVMALRMADCCEGSLSGPGLFDVKRELWVRVFEVGAVWMEVLVTPEGAVVTGGWKKRDQCTSMRFDS